MSPDSARIWELFHAVREMSPEEQSTFLRSAAADDAEVRRRVQALLRAAEDDPRFVKLPVPAEAAAGGHATGEHADTTPTMVMFARTPIPKTIGRYHIKHVIGSGGMGAVYEAIQEHPRRIVALKVLKAGIASRSGLRRFEYESQILARLHHPCIAQVYEAGTHDDGTGAVPFFAMEYIASARSITEYAKTKKLGIRKRLELFEKVCQAVHHGHQKGIIHRDLKPGNILVDADGQPKIIDFGVARSTDSDLAVTTLQTDIGQLIGTIQYMSPEQCEADPHGLDIRSDVYALGVVLYELLTERLPYNVSRSAIHEAARVIREEPPARPSTLDRTLRGDVETITLKALEKDRDRRYQSAEAVADDVRHYLRNEPIQARRPSVGYQLSRFVRRHQGLVAATAVVLSLLVLGIVVTTVLLVRSVRAEELAQEQKTRADNQTVAATKAQSLAVEEKERADAALRRVLSLSDIKLVSDYTAEADELWPAYPERIDDIDAWLKKARILVERLPGHEAELVALRQRAIPRTPAEAAAERASHPRLPALETERGRLTWLLRGLALREGKDVDPTPEPDWDALPEDAGALNEIARPLVDPDRARFGDEARALAIARRAAELAPDDAGILDTLTWALFANARDAEAEDTSRRALAAAPETQREQYEEMVKKLRYAITEASGPEGLDRLRDQIAETEAQVQTLNQEVSARRTWRLSDTSEQWQHQVLAELVERLRAFGARDRNTVADVETRLGFARTIQERSIAGPEARAAWAAAIKSISDRDACPVYDGLRIPPQIGLLPLDRNPQSGLWEFWHIQTGARPVPNPQWPQDAVNRWMITEETGLVFVLIPGGTFRMGSEPPRMGVETEETSQGLMVTAVAAGTLAEDLGLRSGDVLMAVNGTAIEDLGASEPARTERRPPSPGLGPRLQSPAIAGAMRHVLSGASVSTTVLRDGAELELTATAERGIDSPNVDPDATIYESPVHDVTLDAFFLSKYEMTQGQWLRFVGQNPSGYPYENVAYQSITGPHPVERVSWNEADRALGRLALLLPTESQWEYACRAGTNSPWYTGREPRTLAGHAYIKDEGFELLRDAEGYAVHAPIGSFRPNRFGLHDVHGNLWEWCRDRFTGYHAPARPGDGLRDGPRPPPIAPSPVPIRVERGGCFLVGAVIARSAFRGYHPPHLRYIHLGLRPSRVITE